MARQVKTNKFFDMYLKELRGEVVMLWVMNVVGMKFEHLWKYLRKIGKTVETLKFMKIYFLFIYLKSSRLFKQNN